jgi:hypothetical protein
MKKLFHVFNYFNNDINRSWLAEQDFCIYCNKTSEVLYRSLSNDIQRYYSKTNNIRKSQIEIHNMYTPCENGITEEEMMIKEIIE